MKTGTDQFRMFWDEVEARIEKEKSFMKDVKSTISSKRLVSRKRAFEHAYQSLLYRHGVAPGDIRTQLDTVWTSAGFRYGASGPKAPERPKRKWYVLALGAVLTPFLPVVGVPVLVAAGGSVFLPVDGAEAVASVSTAWRAYLEGAVALARRLWEEAPEQH